MRRLAISIFVAAALASTALGQVKFLDESFEYNHDHPAAGLWVGNLHVEDQWWYGVFRIKHDHEDGWSARGIVVPPSISFVAVGAQCKDVTITNGHIELTVPGQIGGTARMTGNVSDDGQRWTGTVTQHPPTGDPIEGKFELARVPEVVDLPRPMAFAGQIEVRVQKLDMTIAFAQTPRGNWVGHVDVPAQMTRGFVLAGLKREGRTFTAVMPGYPPAHINVELDESERRITGTMKQAGIVMDIAFARNDGYVGSELKRPQHPKPPYPYEVREVTIEHPDGHRLAGTLTVPAGKGPHPAAVLISGSGPQDRDETLLGHKPFLVIADYLTRHDIAVLRYDDRGTGQSTGEFSIATTQDFATDALAAVNYIMTQDGVDPERIGLIGHSEGAMVGPMVAGLTAAVAFVVLLAGPGVPGDELLRVQLKLVMEVGGAPEQAIQTALAQQAQFFQLVRQGASAEDLREAMRPVLEAQMKAMGVSDDEELPEQLIEAQLDQLTSPWMRFFLTYDPRPALAEIKCPVLACNGTLDLQVWHEQNLDVIEQRITEAGGDVTAKRYEGLNHLFQPATTGSIAEYATIEITFDETVLRDIVQWIKRKVMDS
ncbi:MAG: alpha/beta fold hydrolase [Planctomycetes bacterium]|nr:alpha/beta fold hydrolase [Planctomycetota bacterium]